MSDKAAIMEAPTNLSSTCRTEIYRISYGVIKIASSKLAELIGFSNTPESLEFFVKGLDNKIAEKGDLVTKETLKEIIISLLFGPEVKRSPNVELDELIDKIVAALTGEVDLEVWNSIQNCQVKEEWESTSEAFE